MEVGGYEGCLVLGSWKDRDRGKVMLERYRGKENKFYQIMLVR